MHAEAAVVSCSGAAQAASCVVCNAAGENASGQAADQRWRCDAKSVQGWNAEQHSRHACKDACCKGEWAAAASSGGAARRLGPARRIGKDLQGFARISNDLRGFVRTRTDLQRFAKISKDLQGSASGRRGERPQPPARPHRNTCADLARILA